MLKICFIWFLTCAGVHTATTQKSEAKRGKNDVLKVRPDIKRNKGQIGKKSVKKYGQILGGGLYTGAYQNQIPIFLKKIKQNIYLI